MVLKWRKTQGRNRTLDLGVGNSSPSECARGLPHPKLRQFRPAEFRMGLVVRKLPQVNSQPVVDR